MPDDPRVVRGKFDNPPGYDTSDLDACAREMADAALLGQNAFAIEAELAKACARLTDIK